MFCSKAAGLVWSPPACQAVFSRDDKVVEIAAMYPDFKYERGNALCP